MNDFPVVSATTLKNQSGRVLDDAQRGPVAITSHGRTRVYVVSAPLFERLQALEDAALGEAATRALAEGTIGIEASAAALRPRSHAQDRPVARRRKSARKAVR